MVFTQYFYIENQNAVFIRKFQQRPTPEAKEKPVPASPTARKTRYMNTMNILEETIEPDQKEISWPRDRSEEKRGDGC